MIGAQVNVLNLFSSKAAGKKAFTLFCTPRKGGIRPKDQDHLKDCQSEAFLTAEFGKVKAYSWNDTGEETVLLVHGWESNSARWRFLIPLLVAEGYRVVSIDAPGHGATDGPLFNIPLYAEAIRAGVDTYSPAYIIGHSVGGASVAYFMSHFPRPSVRRAVIMGAPSELGPIIKGFKHILGLNAASVRSMDKYFQFKFNRKTSYFSIKRFCEGIEVKTLVIHDKGDRVCPVKDGKAIHDHLPQSEMFLTEGFGHGLQDQSVFDRIIEFIRAEGKKSMKNLVTEGHS